MKFNLFKIGIVSATVGAFALPLVARAAVDSNLVLYTDSLGTVIKENILGVIFSSAVLVILAVVAVGFGVIAYVTRFVRKHTGR
jgi:hypothetical protein